MDSQFRFYLRSHQASKYKHSPYFKVFTLYFMVFDTDTYWS